MTSRSFTAPAAAKEHEPLSELNITPLIDVLLVLLVMLILTIPITTHEVPLDLPGADGAPTDPIVHRITIDATGALGWDGVATSAAALPAKLSAMRAAPGAELQIEPAAAAPYARVDETLAVIKRAGITRLGFVGNERFADFSGRGQR